MSELCRTRIGDYWLKDAEDMKEIIKRKRTELGLEVEA